MLPFRTDLISDAVLASVAPSVYGLAMARPAAGSVAVP
jgi:hypothetical protein